MLVFQQLRKENTDSSRSIEQSANKQFKSDSARLAFLVWIEFCVYDGQIKCRGRVLHTLIGR